MVTPVAVPPEGTDAGRLVGGVPLARLVRDFHRPMLNFARTMVDSPAVAEEAVQEAWLQVLRSSDSFQGRSSVGTWLFGIVKHTAARHRRREARIRRHEVLADADIEAVDPLSGRMHPAGHPDAGHWRVPPSRRFLPEDRTVHRELLGYLREALDALPARQRQLVILRDLVGISAEEAAELLQLSAEAQRALLYRARGNLRNELEKRYQP
ncbi:sigma-70 family RNA polymerase sigma factor [Mycobacterium avium subsp. paratuberculosis]|uniref:SigX n=1 Tax=Mycolicibacterium paratuberculosis (strain ATCC BAA-968 / K-10) TaxID=262316 RepID=Q73Z46_MYCPA|nr:sigma-70 family RNA polymerase sigma factor [Mycobacterium avium]ETB01618.1 RNA polymerase sigma 70 [Mycobacterium avium subsp. paratuberculosis 10-4404]ETB03960.1 RNA polymerase sigma 70 [Mycobacterium avium subsp. paratuberculosis 10-5864]ETB11778.1 RNA polymerase sigma 70 [Mycobacterium avium subsp. paratuberculosis 08-8281]ETB32228.1 RNA polymerase sigma 70 [Mycobacterium avium subsp. paratuberculosis 10-5975]ETB39540.1 RNA polymerase sigma 70 [Mycobacterium avium subsp. paratuberculosi